MGTDTDEKKRTFQLDAIAEMVSFVVALIVAIGLAYKGQPRWFVNAWFVFAALLLVVSLIDFCRSRRFKKKKP